MHPFMKIDYSYLRPPASVFRTVEEADQFSHGVRETYFGVSLLENEHTQMEEFQEMLTEDTKLPTWWKTGDGLRLIASNKKITDACDQAKGHIKWVSELKGFNLSEEAAGYLTRGEISICGRDKTGKANLMWEIKTPIKKENSAPLIEALTFAMLILKKYAMVPKYCEKFNLIVNLNKKAPVVISLIRGLMVLFKNNFATYIDKTYIYNTSTLFSLIWKIVEVTLSKHDLETVFFVTVKEKQKFLVDLDGTDLPEMYGGDRVIDAGMFWPPYKSVHEPMTLEEVQEKGIDLFSVGGNSLDKKLFRGAQATVNKELVIETKKEPEVTAKDVEEEKKPEDAPTTDAVKDLETESKDVEAVEVKA